MRREVTIRPYRDDDRKACLEVFESNVPRFFRDHERQEFEAFLADPPGPYYVLVDKAGTVVGCGGYAVHEATGRADLCWGMVAGNQHGRGWGRALTERRIEAIKNDRRVRSICLNTSQHTAQFYERMGFRANGVRTDGYAPGLHRYHMTKDLSDGH